MPVTLANARLLTQDKLAQTVIDEFRKSSAFMDMLVFDDNVSMGGGSTLRYLYDRVTTYGSAAFRAINSDYTQQEAQVTQYSAELKPFGGSFGIDRVIQDDVRGITNQLTLQLSQKIQATVALFCDTFINGDTASVSSAFDGLAKALAGSSTAITPTAAIDLSSTAALDANYNTFMDALDSWLSTMDGVTALLVNNKLKAVLNGIARRSSLFDGNGADAFGQKVLKYAGIPIVVLGDKSGSTDPIIGIDASAKTTSIYAVRIGLDGVHGITPQGGKIVKAYLPKFGTDTENSDAVKKGAVEMVAAMALKATRAAGVLNKIKVLPTA
jgi:hypothetical protein